MMANRRVTLEVVRDDRAIQSGEPLCVPVSFDLPDVLRALLADVSGIDDLRLLMRDSNPKLFVITSDRDLERDFVIVQRMIRIEDIKPGTILNYDIIPKSAAHFVPDDAVSI